MTWRAFGGYSLAAALLFVSSVITQVLLGRPFSGGVLFAATGPALAIAIVLYFRDRRKAQGNSGVK